MVKEKLTKGTCKNFYKKTTETILGRLYRIISKLVHLKKDAWIESEQKKHIITL